MSRPKLWKTGEARQVSPGDLVFLTLMFLIICAVFAIQQGMFMKAPGASGRAPGRDTIVDLRCLRDGAIAIQGQPASLDMVRPAVERALSGDDRAVVVVDAARGSGCALLVELLDQVRLARASRVVLREQIR
ncbi:MAG TPA: biopolymer transporter ExbD [bacterium]|nr:biopolymer transporter ExbD [bacterium]